MNRGAIKQLNGDAARLGLLLITCEGTETLEDRISMAGLSHTHNTHGKNRYTRAFQQLLALHFIELRGRSICVPFEDLISGSDKDVYQGGQDREAEICG